MLVSMIRLVSQKKLYRNCRLIRLRFHSAVSLAHVPPYLSESDSGSDDSNSSTQNFNLSVDNDSKKTITVELCSNDVVEILNNLGKEPFSALSFFNQLKENGFRHNLETYVAMIKVLCHSGLNRKLDYILLDVIHLHEKTLGFNASNLFDAMVETVKFEGVTSLVRAFDALIKAYVSLNMFDEALEILFKLRGHGFDLGPCLLSSNFLMNRLVEHGKVDMAIAVYKEFKLLGLTANVYTYAIVIKAYSRIGCIDEAADVLFRDMDEAGVVPDAFVYTTYLEGLCQNRRSNYAYEVLRACRGTNVAIDIYGYTVVIRGLVNEKNMNEAENVLAGMKEEKLVPDAFCYGALITGYCQMGNITKALDFQEEMVENGIKTNCVIITQILQCLCRMGRAVETAVLFEKFKEGGIEMDEISYNIAIDAFCKIGDLDKAVGLLAEMSGKKMVPDVVHYTIVMNGYMPQEKLSGALRLFAEMKEKGLKPDIVTYNVLAGGLSRKGLLEEVGLLFNHMEDQGLAPTSATHDAVIRGLFLGGKVDEAQMYFSSLEDKSLENCAVMINGYCESNNAMAAYELFHYLFEQNGFIVKKSTCLKLITCLFSEGKYDRGLKLFEMLLSSDEGPCKKMCSKLITALCFAGEMKRARWIFDNMILRGLSPDVIIYTIMLNGYCRVNCLGEAWDLFSEMEKRGICPDIITYTVLLDGYSKMIQLKGSQSETDTGKKEKIKLVTSAFWRDVEKKELIPDVICYTMLIDSHCKSDNLEEAISFFHEMCEAGLAPDTVTYTALLSGYCKQRCVKKAITLVNEISAKGIKPDSALRNVIVKAKRLQFRH